VRQNITSSAVSQRVRALEMRLGTPELGRAALGPPGGKTRRKRAA
jgi:DNA-binding transcriptional LysR family regulator